ncbi:FmdB family zinc ribbon protein [Nocardiopsis changdeensis]|uniref:FmdB family transcriptional regulator n=1 Tax=Nocardiopsis changdeensis TaxID=2831969 RepID=A0ABX8BPD0_9ACTN|nr:MULTISPECIES: FmdB family zinc ribbon protein [Nocardiopsis]QKW32252.1 FmdB family transcriptional regulator [Nocardiopsis flavescens]QUX23575.1 FmdB family transcriptional regulator [Nocardiopsis changdeensis]QYX39519.1 FmdB family transcriptional regulator [Nocardiopsis sp. MT53]
MPTYQYACTECGAQMEVVQSFSDDALTVCPECEGRLRKVYSAVGIVFKGSGFYRTDSGKTSNSSSLTGSSATTAPASGKAESTGSESSSSSSSAKSESTSGSTATATTAATGG